MKNSDVKSNFNVELLPEVVEFLENLEDKVREKVYFNIKKSQKIKNKEFFKKLTDLIWEFRTLYNGKSYRIFSFWDRTNKKETLVIATHGIVKKTQKTPKKEIEKAERIRKLYFENKTKTI